MTTDFLQTLTHHNLRSASAFLLAIFMILQACGDGERVIPIEGPGQISTIAGDGYGFSGDGGPAIDAKFTSISALSVGENGDIYIADDGNGRIRKIDAQTGIVETIAGDGTTVYPGDGLPATTVGLDRIWDLAIDSQDNLFISGGDRPSWFRYLDAETGRVRTLMTQPVLRMTIDADSEGFGYVLGNDDEAIIRIDPTTGDQEFLRLNAEIMNFTVIGPGEIVAFTRDAGYGGGSPLFRLVRFDTVSMEKVEISGPYPPFPFLMGSEYTQLVADVLGRSYPREVVQYDEETVLVVRSGYPHIVIGKIDLNSGDGATVAGNGKGGYSGDGGSSLEAMLSASAIAVEPDGALLIGGGSETRGVRIRRVLPPLPTRDVRLGPE